MADLKLKPLDWREARVSDQSPRFTAETILGNYEALEWSDGSFGGSIPNADRDESNEEFTAPSLDAAKAVCQADYAKRIMALFDVPQS